MVTRAIDLSRRMIGVLLIGAMAFCVSLGLTRTAGAAELVMFEHAGCPWCIAWNRQIGPIYPKTSEGRRAPLRRVDLLAEMPRDLRGIEPVEFSPTFVLVEDGQEIGRILGYPGEDFFWALLAELIGRLPPADSAPGQGAPGLGPQPAQAPGG